MLKWPCVFDWISPALACAPCAAKGWGETFEIPLDSGWTGARVTTILRDHGIETYAHGIDPFSNAACFKVRSEDYERACKVLRVWGVL